MAPGSDTLDYPTRDRLRLRHPDWRLLRSDHAPLVVSFLHRVFIATSERVLAQADLAEALEDELFALRERLGPDAFPRPALQYLNDWVSDERGWLRKFYREGAAEPHFDLTPATERAVAWLGTLTELLGRVLSLPAVAELGPDARTRSGSSPSGTPSSMGSPSWWPTSSSRAAPRSRRGRVAPSRPRSTRRRPISSPGRSSWRVASGGCGALLELQSQVRDYVAVLGLLLVLDEAEGYAYLRSRPEEDDDGAPGVPRLIARRPLPFPVSLLLAPLRKKLAEFDAGAGETRLVLTRGEVVELMRVFLPEGSNEARLIDQVDTHLNRVVELGFLRRLKTAAGQEAALKAFVFVSDDALAGFRLQRLEVYNWGTFDRRVWTLHLDGKGSLLTGDIDTHGFVILDQLRAYLPHARSFLMDRKTLLAHERLWGEEPRPVRRELTKLEPGERELYDELRAGRIGVGRKSAGTTCLRLEQERVAFGWVEKALEKVRAGR